MKKPLLICFVLLIGFLVVGCKEVNPYADTIAYDRSVWLSRDGLGGLNFIYGDRGWNGSYNYMYRFYYEDDGSDFETMKFIVDGVTIADGNEYNDLPAEYFDISSSNVGTILNGADMRIELRNSMGTLVNYLTDDNIATIKEFFTGYSVSTIILDPYVPL